MTTPETSDDNFLVTCGVDELLNDGIDYVIGNITCTNDNSTEIKQDLDAVVKHLLDDLAEDDVVEQNVFLHFFYEIYANAFSCCKT